MIAIRAEITAIAAGRMDKTDNPLKNAPHTAREVMAEAWTHGYTRTQAASVAHQNIRVNCICPGSIFFDGGTWDVAKRDNPPLYAATLASCPAGRMGTPEEVANVAVFLASPLASWITAQVISVNGGQGLRR